MPKEQRSKHKWLAFMCLDCKVDTSEIREYYMLKDSVWNQIYDSKVGMFCIGCCEARLKRELTPEDFKECFLNTKQYGQKSDRLAKRLGLIK